MINYSYIYLNVGHDKEYFKLNMNMPIAKMDISGPDAIVLVYYFADNTTRKGNKLQKLMKYMWHAC